MEVTATVDLSEQDQLELAKILGCNGGELPDKLRTYSSAALKEYISMFLGQRVFRRGSDINEFRLFLLVATVFDNRIPDEQEVCRLFQTSATESRALIRAVMSKYQYQLREAIDNSIRRALDAAEQEDEHSPHVVTLNSHNVVEELNRTLAGIDGTLEQIRKKRGSVSTYEIAQSAYARLREQYPENE
ncbi:hypothetical protein [Thiococcus pfennigii]|uniref:hypothetical protein n=1 Tax=Thiococcus pfennigii TaxID=1057 RepID=UPI0019056A75|nr:hypothetical protein [Thiococcus pfennigii]MBK1702395.1 hypothetical protein [Thiococcus pfennigii]